MAKNPKAKVDVEIQATGAAKFKAATKGLGTGLTVGLITAVAEGKKFKAVWEGVKWGAMARVGVANLALISGSAIAATKAIIGLVRGSEAMARGLERAANIEMKTTQFESLLKGASLAKQRIAELVDFADKTPFEIEGIAEASKMLEVLGRGDLSGIKTITMVGDAAAVAGRELNEVAFWIGRFYDGVKSGRPVGEAATRLQEMGLITGDLRARIESLNQAGGDMTVVWGEVEAALGRTKGGMEKMSETMKGLQSTYDDTRASLDQALAKNFLDEEKKKLEDIIKIMKNLTPVFEDTGAVIAAISGPVNTAGKAFLAWATSLKIVQVAIGTLTRAIVALAVVATPVFIYKLIKALISLNLTTKAVTVSTRLLSAAQLAGRAAALSLAKGNTIAGNSYIFLGKASKKAALGLAAFNGGAKTAAAAGAGAQAIPLIGKAKIPKGVVAGFKVATKGISLALRGIGKAFSFLVSTFLGKFLGIIGAVAVVWQLIGAFKKAKEAGNAVTAAAKEMNTSLMKMASTVKNLNGLWEYQDKIAGALSTAYEKLGTALGEMGNDSELAKLLGMSEASEEVEALQKQISQLKAMLSGATSDDRFSKSKKDRELAAKDDERKDTNKVRDIDAEIAAEKDGAKKIRLIREKKLLFEQKGETGRDIDKGNAETEKRLRGAAVKGKADSATNEIKSILNQIEAIEDTGVVNKTLGTGAGFIGAAELKEDIAEAKKQKEKDISKGMDSGDAELKFNRTVGGLLKEVSERRKEGGRTFDQAGNDSEDFDAMEARGQALLDESDKLEAAQEKGRQIKRESDSLPQRQAQAKADAIRLGTKNDKNGVTVKKDDVNDSMKETLSKFGAVESPSGDLSITLEQLQDIDVAIDKNAKLAAEWTNNLGMSDDIQREINAQLRQQKEIREEINAEIDATNAETDKIKFEAEVGKIKPLDVNTDLLERSLDKVEERKLEIAQEIDIKASELKSPNIEAAEALELRDQIEALNKEADILASKEVAVTALLNFSLTGEEKLDKLKEIEDEKAEIKVKLEGLGPAVEKTEKLKDELSEVDKKEAELVKERDNAESVYPRDLQSSKKIEEVNLELKKTSREKKAIMFELAGAEVAISELDAIQGRLDQLTNEESKIKFGTSLDAMARMLKEIEDEKAEIEVELKGLEPAVEKAKKELSEIDKKEAELVKERDNAENALKTNPQDEWGVGARKLEEINLELEKTSREKKAIMFELAGAEVALSEIDVIQDRLDQLTNKESKIKVSMDAFGKLKEIEDEKAEIKVKLKGLEPAVEKTEKLKDELSEVDKKEAELVKERDNAENALKTNPQDDWGIEEKKLEEINLELEKTSREKKAIMFELAGAEVAISELDAIQGRLDQLTNEESKIKVSIDAFSNESDSPKTIAEKAELKKVQAEKIEVEMELKGVDRFSDDGDALTAKLRELTEKENELQFSIAIPQKEKAEKVITEIQTEKTEIQVELAGAEEGSKKAKALQDEIDGLTETENLIKFSIATPKEKFDILRKEENDRLRKSLEKQAEDQKLPKDKAKAFVEAGMNRKKATDDAKDDALEAPIKAENNSAQSRLRIEQLILQGKFEAASKEQEMLDAAEARLKKEQRINELVKGGMDPDKAADFANQEEKNKDQGDENTKNAFRKDSKLRAQRDKAIAEGDKKKARAIDDFEEFESIKKRGMDNKLGATESEALARDEMKSKIQKEAKEALQVTGSYLQSIGGGGRAVGNDPAKIAAERLQNLDKTTQNIYKWLENNKNNGGQPDDTFTI